LDNPVAQVNSIGENMKAKIFSIQINLPTLIGLMIFIMFSTIQAETYYVDATRGNDNNDGLTPSKAWKSIAKVNISSFKPGDSILFKRGEEWRGTSLDINDSGTSGNPITFGAYGSGDLPMITSATLVTTWSDEGGNVWSATYGGSPWQVLRDTTFLTQETVSCPGGIGTNEWCASGGTLYIYSTVNPDTLSSPGVQASTDNTVSIHNTNYIIVEYLQLDQGYRSVYVTGTSSNIEMRYLNVFRAGYGIDFYDNDGSNNSVHHSDISYSGSGIYIHGQSGDGYHFYKNTIYYMDWDEEWQADGAAVGIQNSDDHIIEYNYFHHCKNAIDLWTDQTTGLVSEDVIIRYNIIADGKKNWSQTWYGTAIGMKPDAANLMTGYQVYENLIYNHNFGVSFRHAMNPPNKVYNNVICIMNRNSIISRCLNTGA